jgi:hypothetical protein
MQFYDDPIVHPEDIKTKEDAFKKAAARTNERA